MRLIYFSNIIRKIHRLCSLVTAVLGLIMLTTGTVMKYPNLLPFIDPVQVRLLHFNTSTYFSIFISVMLITGVYLYFYPWLVKRVMRQQNETVPTSSNSK